MFRLLSRYRDLIVVASLLVYPLGSFLISGHRGREPHFIDRAVLWLASSFQGGLTAVVDSGSNVVSGYVALRGAHQDADACRAELATALAEANALKEMQLENERLRKLLGDAATLAPDQVFARVVALAPASNLLAMRINRGESDGVQVGMPVVTTDGIVGHVSRVVAGSADVVLISDASSRVAAVVQRSRVRSTIAGTGTAGTLALDNVLRTDDVVEGDVLVTSGTDGVFPRGLRVGTVEAVLRGTAGMFLSGTVKPAADLQRVAEVRVLLTPVAPPAALSRPGGGKP